MPIWNSMPKSKQSQKNYKEPAFIKRMKSAQIDRRTFLWQMALLSTSTILPLSSCVKPGKPLILKGRDPKIFSEDEWKVLVAAQDVLFPSEEDSPGAREINAASFVQWVVSDAELDPEERKFLKDGLKWLNEDAVERWQMNFIEMEAGDQDKLLRHVETHSWGESWISVMLLHIFEALLSDPVYGGNKDEVGWDWLGYTAGQPRPGEEKMYGNFLGASKSTF